MDDLVVGDLTLALSKPKAGLVRLEWRGSSTARQPKEFLAPYFDQLCSEASESGAGIEMRFADLKYFNSSTITAIIHMIKEARAHEVRLELVTVAGNHTQRQSFDALRIFGRDDGLLVFREEG